jgi:26S proteasome regulatory subunit N10
MGVISMAGKRVNIHATLNQDLARILTALKEITLSGNCDFITSLNICVLTLKHRQNKNQKQKIVLFVGSPITHPKEEMLQTARKLKKMNIGVDVISFGPVDLNRDILNQFVETVKNANNSSLLEVPVGFFIMDSLFSSPIMTGDAYNDNNVNQDNNMGGSNVGGGDNIPSSNQSLGMSQFERDINLAIQQSMEEEEKRKEEKDKINQDKKPLLKSINENVEEEDEEDEEAALERAKQMSILENQKTTNQNTNKNTTENKDFLNDILKGINDTGLSEKDIKEIIDKTKKDEEKKKKEEEDPNKKKK